MKWRDMLSALSLSLSLSSCHSTISPLLFFPSYFIFIFATSSKKSDWNHCFTFIQVFNRIKFFSFYFWFLIYCYSIAAWSRRSGISLMNQNLRTTPRNHEEKVFFPDYPHLMKTLQWLSASEAVHVVSNERDVAWSQPRLTLPLALPMQTSHWAFGPRVLQQSTGLPSGYWINTESVQSNPEHSRNQNFRTMSHTPRWRNPVSFLSGVECYRPKESGYWLFKCLYLL